MFLQTNILAQYRSIYGREGVLYETCAKNTLSLVCCFYFSLVPWYVLGPRSIQVLFLLRVSSKMIPIGLFPAAVTISFGKRKSLGGIAEMPTTL
jgi:hypothetical protein